MVSPCVKWFVEQCIKNLPNLEYLETDIGGSSKEDADLVIESLSKLPKLSTLRIFHSFNYTNRSFQKFFKAGGGETLQFLLVA